MLKSIIAKAAMKRGAKFVPGGWITMLALSPTGRRAIRSGWDYAQKRRQGRPGGSPRSPR